MRPVVVVVSRTGALVLYKLVEQHSDDDVLKDNLKCEEGEGWRGRQGVRDGMST